LDDVKWLISQEIPRLRRYALALTDDPDAADDLVQDCLERAMRKRHQWTRQGSIRGWLLRILQRRFYDQCGKSRPSDVPVDGLADTLVDGGGGPEAQMAVSDIRAAMQRLPEDQRAAIALTALEGLAYDEAAEVLNVPVGTLRSRLARGRETLRQVYRGEPTATLRRVK